MTQDELAEALHATSRCLFIGDEDLNAAQDILAALDARGYALVRTPETLDVDALVASLPAVRRRTDVQPMIPESAVRRLLTTLAATPSPTPPEGHISERQPGRVALAAFPAPDPGAELAELRDIAEEALDLAEVLDIMKHHERGISTGPCEDEATIVELRRRLAAFPAPDPGAGLREATVQPDNAYDGLYQESGLAGAAPSAEPPETETA